MSRKGNRVRCNGGLMSPQQRALNPAARPENIKNHNKYAEKPHQHEYNIFFLKFMMSTFGSAVLLFLIGVSLIVIFKPSYYTILIGGCLPFHAMNPIEKGDLLIRKIPIHPCLIVPLLILIIGYLLTLGILEVSLLILYYFISIFFMEIL